MYIILYIYNPIYIYDPVYRILYIYIYHTIYIMILYMYHNIYIYIHMCVCFGLYLYNRKNVLVLGISPYQAHPLRRDVSSNCPCESRRGWSSPSEICWRLEVKVQPFSWWLKWQWKLLVDESKILSWNVMNHLLSGSHSPPIFVVFPAPSSTKLQLHAPRVLWTAGAGSGCRGYIYIYTYIYIYMYIYTYVCTL